MGFRRVFVIGVITVLIFAAWAGVQGQVDDDERGPAAPGQTEPEAEDAAGGAGGLTGPSGYEYPGPKADFPTGPQRLALELEGLRAALAGDIEYWIAEGTPRNKTARRWPSAPSGTSASPAT